MHPDAILFDLVQHLLRQRWSPEQVALTLACIYPKSHELRVSHETIYNCIYAHPVGELRKELISQHASRSQQTCTPQQKLGPTRPNPRHAQHPPEVQNRQFPDHWEGDLIKGEVMPAPSAPWSSAPAGC